MKTEYKDFRLIENPSGFTLIYKHDNTEMGKLYYHWPIDKYVFEPFAGWLLSKEYLLNIVNALNQLEIER